MTKPIFNLPVPTPGQTTKQLLDGEINRVVDRLWPLAEGGASDVLDEVNAALEDAAATLSEVNLAARGRQYVTRAEAVADIADGYDPAAGTVITAGGLAYVRSEGADAIADLPGWLPFGEITAGHFGFSVSGVAYENGAAIAGAIAYATGRRVHVDATADFVSSRVVIEQGSADLKFRGPGRWLVEATGCITFTGEATDIQTVTAISKVSVTVQGSPVTVQRLAVADSSAYQKDDIVKVVSDEDDPYDARADRKRGEWATVIGTAAGYIYLTSALEDAYDTAQNCRVARIIPHRFALRGLRVASQESNEAVILQISAAIRPFVQLEADAHGYIVVNSKGSYHGEFWLKGSGKGDSAGSLGYLFNDSSGEGNRCLYPEGRYFRHVTTTNADANPTALWNYGATRSHHVLGGVSIGAQGAPWDTHSGARRTIWEDCRDLRAMRSSSSAPAAFQHRARDAIIINPTTDGSQEEFLRLSNALGTVTVIGGVIDLAGDTGAKLIVPSGGAYDRNKVSVQFQGGVIRGFNRQTFMDINNVSVSFIGTRFDHSNSARAFSQQISVANANVHFSGAIMYIDVQGSSPRIFRLYDNAHVSGDMRIFWGGTGAMANSVRVEGDTNIAMRGEYVVFGRSNVPSVFNPGNIAFSDYRFLAGDDVAATGVARRSEATTFDAGTFSFIVRNLPTSAEGLLSGSLWNDGGTVKVV